MKEPMSHLLMEQQLQWLGHVARMEPYRLPNQMLFGELLKKRLCHGTKRRWRDVAVADLKAVGIDDSWFELPQDRNLWKALCKDGLRNVADHEYSCLPSAATNNSSSYPCQCGRSFCRQGDCTRHQQFCGVEN